MACVDYQAGPELEFRYWPKAPRHFKAKGPSGLGHSGRASRLFGEFYRVGPAQAQTVQASQVTASAPPSAGAVFRRCKLSQCARANAPRPGHVFGYERQFQVISRHVNDFLALIRSRG